jgi:Diacylglycerol kinase catalytic domain
MLEEMNGPCQVYFTENFQHISKLASKATEANTGLIIAVGGDGTLSGVGPKQLPTWSCRICFPWHICTFNATFFTRLLVPFSCMHPQLLLS